MARCSAEPAPGQDRKLMHRECQRDGIAVADEVLDYITSEMIHRGRDETQAATTTQSRRSSCTDGRMRRALPPTENRTLIPMIISPSRHGRTRRGRSELRQRHRPCESRRAPTTRWRWTASVWLSLNDHRTTVTSGPDRPVDRVEWAGKEATMIGRWRLAWLVSPSTRSAACCAAPPRITLDQPTSEDVAAGVETVAAGAVPEPAVDPCLVMDRCLLDAVRVDSHQCADVELSSRACSWVSAARGWRRQDRRRRAGSTD